VSHPPISEQVTFLYTTDLAATSRFWGEVVGLEMVLDQGSCHIFRTGPSSYVGCCQRADRPRSPVGLTFSLVTPDVDGWYATLVERGVEFVAPPAYSEDFQVYACLFHDPNGYRIEIQEFRDPRWPGA